MIIWDNLGGGFVSREAEVVIQLWIHVIIMINVICVSSVYVWRLEIKLYHLAGHRESITMLITAFWHCGLRMSL